MLKKILILYVIICFFLLFCTIGLSSEEYTSSIIYISKSGDGDFTSIQEGIDAAISGDIIYIYNGTYFENIVIDKSISLIGENINNTIIDGRNVGNCIKINIDNVTVEGFTIKGSGNIYPNSGINLSSNNNLIQENIILDNTYGLTLYFSSGNIIKKNTIQNNNNCGIYLSTSNNNKIINNIIQNHFYNGIGLYYSSVHNTIINNNFFNNSFCGVNIRSSFNNNISSNNFSNNNIGIHLPSSNIANNNAFSNNNIDIEEEYITYGNEWFLLILFLVIIVIIGLFLFWKIKKRKN